MNIWVGSVIGVVNLIFFYKLACASIYRFTPVPWISTVPVGYVLLCPVVLGTKPKFPAFIPLVKILGARFWDFWGAARRVYLPRVCLPGCHHRGHGLIPLPAHFGLKMVHYQRKILWRGKKRSNLWAEKAPPEPGWDLRSRARVPPTGATDLPTLRARGAAVQDNVYFLSLITRFFLKGKKKISFGSKIVFMIQSDKTEHVLV